MPVDFLTTEQTESYGRFTGEPDELQLARYFHLDEADKEFIGKSRGDHNRLGIALQIGCVRFLGTFLTDMNHIPSGVRHFIARQLAIHDITVLAEYGQRENTRREHAALIRQHYDYREFAWPWTFRLTRLLYTRSWISNERPGLLFDLATGWLMQHRIILPGATRLTATPGRICRRRHGLHTHRTGKVSIHNSILPGTAASCRRMHTVAIMRCTKTAVSRKRPVWHMPGGKSTTSMPARRPASPPKRSGASVSCMPSRLRYAAVRRTGGWLPEKQEAFR